MKTLKRKSDPAIITSDKKKRKIERLTVGDVLEQECDISDFKAHSLVAVVFLQSIDSAGEELLDSFHRQYYDYQYIGLEIIIVTADKVEVVTKLKAEKDYPFAVYSDPCHDISKSYQMLKNDKIKRTILLVTPHLKVVKIIDYFSASYVAKLIKKEAIEFIDLDAKGTEVRYST
jgi:peroxiredoxin